MIFIGNEYFLMLQTRQNNHSFKISIVGSEILLMRPFKYANVTQKVKSRCRMELVTRELQQYYRTDQFDLVVTLILYLGDASFQFCPAFNAF